MRTKTPALAVPKINAFISYSHEDRKYAGQIKTGWQPSALMRFSRMKIFTFHMIGAIESFRS
jgi:hypothetical protein